MKIPKQVIIEVTNRCNLKCRYCPSLEDSIIPKGDMSLDMFKSIVDRMDFEATVIPWMNGEPFLNKDYLEMLQYLDKKRKEYYVTTSLTVWREDVITHILESEYCYQLIISMDGMPDTGNIEKCRPGTVESSLIENLDRVILLKRQLNSSTDIAVKICDRGQDYGEIEDYIKYWIPRVDYVCVGKALNAINTEIMRTKPCQYFDNNFMVIRYTGDLPICSYNHEAVNYLKGSYGNIMSKPEEPLSAYYNNYSIAELRNKQNRGEYAKPCDTCGFAYTGMGYEGTVKFRGHATHLYYHEDYYNKFFSLRHKAKPDEYYEVG